MLEISPIVLFVTLLTALFVISVMLLEVSFQILQFLIQRTLEFKRRPRIPIRSKFDIQA